MNFPPPPPGMPGVPPPPGFPVGFNQAPGFNSNLASRMPADVLAHKASKWIQMQKKRYGEKRKGGYVDMGKQVSLTI